MNKVELVSAVAEKTGVTKKVADEIVTATFASIVEGLQDEGKVQISNFGSFEVHRRAARTGVNPRTKEVVEIPSSRVPSFKAGKALKEAVK